MSPEVAGQVYEPKEMEKILLRDQQAETFFSQEEMAMMIHTP